MRTNVNLNRRLIRITDTNMIYRTMQRQSHNPTTSTIRRLTHLIQNYLQRSRRRLITTATGHSIVNPRAVTRRFTRNTRRIIADNITIAIVSPLRPVRISSNRTTQTHSTATNKLYPGRHVRTTPIRRANRQVLRSRIVRPPSRLI